METPCNISIAFNEGDGDSGIRSGAGSSLHFEGVAIRQIHTAIAVLVACRRTASNSNYAQRHRNY